MEGLLGLTADEDLGGALGCGDGDESEEDEVKGDEEEAADEAAAEAADEAADEAANGVAYGVAYGVWYGARSVRRATYGATYGLGILNSIFDTEICLEAIDNTRKQ